jgi:hypothetical protein
MSDGSWTWEFAGRFGVYVARCEKFPAPLGFMRWSVELRVDELVAAIDHPVNWLPDAAAAVDAIEGRLAELFDLEIQWRPEMSYDFVPVVVCVGGTTRISVFVADDDEWPSAYIIMGLGGMRVTFEELWLAIDCSDLKEVRLAQERVERFVEQLRKR